jgi:tetratricopeptide (TPR) repeat protein
MNDRAAPAAWYRDDVAYLKRQMIAAETLEQPAPPAETGAFGVPARADVSRARKLLRSLRLPHELDRNETVRALRRAGRKGDSRAIVLGFVNSALEGCHPLVHRVIELVDVQCKSGDQVAKALNLSERQFYRYRAVAVSAIAHAMRGSLDPSASPDANDAGTTGLLGLARASFERPSRASLTAALEYFGRAVVRDPADAGAWAAAGEAHFLTGLWLWRDPRAAFRDAADAVGRALARNPNLAEAHVIRGALAAFRDAGMTRADALLSKALELDPACFSAHVIRWWFARLQRDAPAAAGAIARGLARYPASPSLQTALGVAYLVFGEPERAVEQLGAALQFDPAFAPARFELAAALVAQHAWPAAQLHLERLLATEPSPSAFAAAAFVHAIVGEEARAQRDAAALEEQCARRVPRHLAALVELGLGRADRAEKELRACTREEIAWTRLPWFNAFFAEFLAQRGCTSVAQLARSSH